MAGANADRLVRKGAGGGRCLWRGARDRLRPVTSPLLDPSFTIDASAKVFTLGSCFARNIERSFSELGFEVPTMRFRNHPVTEDMPDRELLNLYSPGSLLEELRWVHELLERREEVVRRSDVEDLIVDRGDGSFVDLRLARYLPKPFEHIMRTRQSLYEVYQEAFSSDVVVITLGLIEAWVDARTGKFIQKAPTPSEIPNCRSRFEFRLLTYEECKWYVSEAIALLRRRGQPKIMITTSPVPMNRTFRDMDVIVANMESKSVLRSVCGALAREFDDVDYIPSYEAALLSEGWTAFQDDLIHVRDDFVDRIVSSLTDAYFPNLAVSKMLRRRAELAVNRGESSLATDWFNGAAEAAESDAEVAAIRVQQAKSCYRLGELSRCLDLIGRMSPIVTSQNEVAMLYCKCLSGLGRHQEAITSARQLIQSRRADEAECWFLIGISLVRLGKAASAVDAFRAALGFADSPACRLELARAYALDGSPQLALREVKGIADAIVNEGQARVAMHVAELCGDIALAISIGLAYVKLLPEGSELLAECRRLVGHIDGVSGTTA